MEFWSFCSCALSLFRGIMCNVAVRWCDVYGCKYLLHNNSTSTFPRNACELSMSERENLLKILISGETMQIYFKSQLGKQELVFQPDVKHTLVFWNIKIETVGVLWWVFSSTLIFENDMIIMKSFSINIQRNNSLSGLCCMISIKKDTTLSNEIDLINVWKFIFL